ncbi:MAG: TonB-dependent receptor [Vicinamibacterales bacterium]
MTLISVVLAAAVFVLQPPTGPHPSPASAARASVVLAASAALAQPTSLSGRVTDPSDAAIPEAQVEAVGPDGPVPPVISGRDGTFTIAGLSPGTYRIGVSAPGFDDREVEVEVPTPRAIAIRLSPAGIAETVSVSVTRTPMPVTAIPSTVTILERGVLDRQTAVSGDLASVLESSVPGFSTSLKKLTGRGETLRGRNPLYMINGVPLHTPLRDGDRDGAAIDLDFVERIEVVHGSNAIQGIGATGGVVNMVTKSPKADGSWTHDLRLSTGSSASFDGDSATGKASYLLGKRVGRVAFVAGASIHKRGMFVDANGDFVGLYATQGDIMDSTSRNFYGKLSADLAPSQRIEASVNDFRLARDGDFLAVDGNRATGVLTTSVPGDSRPSVGDPAVNDVATISGEYRHTAVWGGELVAQLFSYDYRALFEGGSFTDFALTTGGPAFLDQSAITTEKVGAKFTYAAPASRLAGLNALVGLDLTRDDSAQVLARTNRVWVPYTVLNDVAPFVQVQRPVTDRLLVSGGLRAEVARLSVDDFVTIPSARSTPVAGGSPSFTEFLPNAGIIVYPWRALSLYASYSEGFTMPDAGRVLRAVNTLGQDVDTLLDIDPVITGNIEVGGTWTSSRSRMHLAYYRSNAERGSLLELLPSGVFSVQRQRTEIQGVDLRVDVPLGADWLAGLTYSWIDGRLDSDRDDRVDADLDGLNIGPNRVNVFVEGTRRWLSGRVQASRLFDRGFDGTAAQPGRNFSGYTLADLSLAATTGAGVIRLGVDNLFNHQYTTYFSQVEPNQGTNTYFAGVGRSLLLSFERRF